MHNRILDAMRKAGSAIQTLDRGYSDKIEGMYSGAGPLAQTFGYMAGGASPSFVRTPYNNDYSRAENAVTQYAIPAANAVSKYVLPAAGVTLAGQGLIDLTAQFGGTADEQQPQELRL